MMSDYGSNLSRYINLKCYWEVYPGFVDLFLVASGSVVTWFRYRITLLRGRWLCEDRKVWFRTVRSVGCWVLAFPPTMCSQELIQDLAHSERVQHSKLSSSLLASFKLWIPVVPTYLLRTVGSYLSNHPDNCYHRTPLTFVPRYLCKACFNLFLGIYGGWRVW